MPVIYCDREDCIYCCQDECQRTQIKVESEHSVSGAYCVSVEIKDREKAPASTPASQEQK